MPNRKIHQDQGYLEGGRDSAESIVAGRQRDRFRGVAFRWLQLAEVTGLETNEDGSYTGYVKTQLLAMEGTREKVRVACPAAGNGQFVGGVPETGSVVVLGWLPGGIPVALAQLPFSITALREDKGLPDLIGGEYLIQAGTVESDGSRVSGGRIVLDKNGRVIVESKDRTAEVMVGPALTSGGEAEEDGVTENPIILSCRIKDASGNTLSRLTFDDSGGVTLSAERVRVATEEMTVGSEDDSPSSADQLLTRKWFNTKFASHVHTGVGGPPATPFNILGDGERTEVLRSK